MRPDRPRLFVTDALTNSKSWRVVKQGLEFLVGWGRCSDALGGPARIEEYAEFIGVARAQAFRMQAAFRQCFPNDDVAVTWSFVGPLVRRRSRLETESISDQAMYVATLKRGTANRPLP